MLEQFDDALAVALPRGYRPVVLDSFQQLAAAQLERGVRLTVRQSFELDRVDPQPALGAQADPLAFDRDRSIAELAPQCPQGGPEAGAGALVEHVGPEARRQFRTGDRSIGEREIAEQRPGAL